MREDEGPRVMRRGDYTGGHMICSYCETEKAVLTMSFGRMICPDCERHLADEALEDAIMLEIESENDTGQCGW